MGCQGFVAAAFLAGVFAVGFVAADSLRGRALFSGRSEISPDEV